jgi:hypothetical protein
MTPKSQGEELMTVFRSRSFAAAIGLLLGLMSIVPAFAQQLAPEVAPAPAAVGADVPVTYFGPAPSSVQKELIGPYQLLKSGQIDQNAGTITLPLYKGRLQDGRTLWYVLTDTDDPRNAEALGLNFSSKLTYADTGHAVRTANIGTDNLLVFDRGVVDFSPVHTVVAGDQPNPFPPSSYNAGSVGDADYSPLVRIVNSGNHVYNAPIVAFGVDASQINFCDGNADHTLVHDKVVKICPTDGTVTLNLTQGFSFARPILYLSTEASDPLAAALENATYAPALADVTVGHDDSAFSAVERLFAEINGPTGANNPQRQGFDSALTDGRGPLNVFGGIPTIATDYSPLWDVNLGEWSAEAVSQGYRSRVTEEFQILGLVEKGWITGPGGSKYGSSGIIINCPPVFRFL